MIDEATRTVASFEKVMAICKRYHSIDSNIGISKNEKDHCRQQFQRLMKLQLENSQVTHPEMKDAGLPVDIDFGGNEMLEDRPSGPHAEHWQTVKTINGPTQKRMRIELLRKRIAESHRNVVVECNTIKDVLLRIEAVAQLILSKMGNNNKCLANAKVVDFSI